MRWTDKRVRFSGTRHAVLQGVALPGCSVTHETALVRAALADAVSGGTPKRTAGWIASEGTGASKPAYPGGCSVEFRETTTQRLLSFTLIEVSRLVDTLGSLKAGLNPPLRSLYG